MTATAGRHEIHLMPNSTKNQAGGHSHPQKDDKNSTNQRGAGDDNESSGGKVLPSGEKTKSHQGPKEDFGSKGPKDSH